MTHQHQDGSLRRPALRVLIEDDSRMALTVLENLLIEGGYEVAAVRIGASIIVVIWKGFAGKNDLRRLRLRDAETLIHGPAVTGASEAIEVMRKGLQDQCRLKADGGGT